MVSSLQHTTGSISGAEEAGLFVVHGRNFVFKSVPVVVVLMFFSFVLFTFSCVQLFLYPYRPSIPIFLLIELVNVFDVFSFALMFSHNL